MPGGRHTMGGPPTLACAAHQCASSLPWIRTSDYASSPPSCLLGTRGKAPAAQPAPSSALSRAGRAQAGTPPCPAYNIRVLIPCYTESLDIVATVVLAAADALLPGKCRRTVYLLDDGKDRAKAAWVAAQARRPVRCILLVAR